VCAPEGPVQNCDGHPVRSHVHEQRNRPAEWRQDPPVQGGRPIHAVLTRIFAGSRSGPASSRADEAAGSSSFVVGRSGAGHVCGEVTPAAQPCGRAIWIDSPNHLVRLEEQRRRGHEADGLVLRWEPVRTSSAAPLTVRLALHPLKSCRRQSQRAERERLSPCKHAHAWTPGFIRRAARRSRP
jgi:hypothetical protein